MARSHTEGYVDLMIDPGARRMSLQRARQRPPDWARLPCLLMAMFAFACIGCGPTTAERRVADPRPNLLLISLDTTRSDHLSVYGYERATSPRLEAFAREGLLFEAAYAPSATTGPTHASIFTGLYPMAHNVRKNGQVLGPELLTLAERLTEGGFETGAVVSSFVLSEQFGYGQGFESFDEDFSEASVPEGVTIWEGRQIDGKFYGSAEDTTRRALSWLDGRESKDRPFFLFVHYFDPHDPYTPPPGWTPPFEPGPKAALKQVRINYLYDLLLSFTDHWIGALFDGLAERDLERDTLVVVVGDHGEGLMDHGHGYHGAHIYEEAVRVPLIARWPGRIAAGERVSTPIAILDLAPTMLELLDLEAGEIGDQATSRAGRFLGQAAGAGDEPVFLYRRLYEPGELSDGTSVVGEQFGVREGSFKLIEAPEEGTIELYDLATDPKERENLADRHPERVAHLRQLLDAWKTRSERVRGPARPLTDEEKARLEALGYGE